eukprot:SAG31_NODE_6414_length_2028_cov_9.931052_4_plen_91_part_00
MWLIQRQKATQRGRTGELSVPRLLVRRLDKVHVGPVHEVPALVTSLPLTVRADLHQTGPRLRTTRGALVNVFGGESVRHRRVWPVGQRRS